MNAHYGLLSVPRCSGENHFIVVRARQKQGVAENPPTPASWAGRAAGTELLLLFADKKMVDLFPQEWESVNQLFQKNPSSADQQVRNR
jgi:hypothetical protein